MHSHANWCWPPIVVAGVLALGIAQAHACDSTADCGGRIVAAENMAQVDTSAEPAITKPSHHSGHHSHHASRSHAEKQAKSSDSEQKKADADHKDASPAGDDFALSSTVANAKAQFMMADANPPAPGANAAPVVVSPPTAPPSETAVTDVPSNADDTTPIVAADELNEVDRAAMPEKPTGQVLHPVPQNPHVANATSEDTWNHTSLIGKVFIVFGGLLTLASAARMFFA